MRYHENSMRNILLSLALFLLSLLTAFAIAEVAMRALGIGWPLFTQADEWTGFALRPGAAGWVRDEGEAYVKINSAGMRDREHAKEKKPIGKIRVAILGDSYAEARQVPMEDAFPSVIERNLAQCGGRDGQEVEVLNFGVSGFGTAQQLLQLQSRVWDYRPDVVLLAFTTGNDVRNNSFALEKNPDKPYMKIQSGSLVADFSFRDRPFFKKQMSVSSKAAQWIVSHSRVAQLLNRVRTVWRSAPGKKPSAPAVATGEAGLDDAIYLEPPPTPEWAEAWSLTEAILTRMSKDVQEHGAKFLVVTLTNGIQVHPDPAMREAFAKKMGVQDLYGPERRISALGARESFPVLTLAQTLGAFAEGGNRFLHGFANATIGEGHWNAEGHRQAGVEMANILCADGFLQ